MIEEYPIESTVKEIVLDIMPECSRKYDITTSFKKLGADDLDKVEIIMFAEETYGIEITEDQLEACLYPKDLITLIDSLIENTLEPKDKTKDEPKDEPESKWEIFKSFFTKEPDLVEEDLNETAEKLDKSIEEVLRKFQKRMDNCKQIESFFSNSLQILITLVCDEKPCSYPEEIAKKEGDETYYFCAEHGYAKPCVFDQSKELISKVAEWAFDEKNSDV